MRLDQERLLKVVGRALAAGRRPHITRVEIERTVQELRALQVAPDRRVLLALAESLGAGRPRPEVAEPLLERLLAQTIARLEALAEAPLEDGPLDLEALQERAILALERFLGPAADTGVLWSGLRPEPEDYALVFAPEVVARAAEAYGALWAAPEAFPVPGRGQTDLLCEVAWAEDLGGETLPPLFPDGYHRAASALLPGRAWVAWKFVRPGSATGLAFNGLVWLDGRWAFFPKPYRVLRLGREA